VDIYSSTGRPLCGVPRNHGDWLNRARGVVASGLRLISDRFSHDPAHRGNFCGVAGIPSLAGFNRCLRPGLPGKFDGLLEDASGKPLAINGVWALSPGKCQPLITSMAARRARLHKCTSRPDQTMASGWVGLVI